MRCIVLTLSVKKDSSCSREFILYPPHFTQNPKKRVSIQSIEGFKNGILDFFLITG